MIRHVLRDMLIDALPTDMHINWDDGCTAARILPKKKVQVDLEDRSTDICDFLIADDGTTTRRQRFRVEMFETLHKIRV